LTFINRSVGALNLTATRVQICSWCHAYVCRVRSIQCNAFAFKEVWFKSSNLFLLLRLAPPQLLVTWRGYNEEQAPSYALLQDITYTNFYLWIRPESHKTKPKRTQDSRFKPKSLNGFNMFSFCFSSICVRIRIPFGLEFAKIEFSRPLHRNPIWPLPEFEESERINLSKPIAKQAAFAVYLISLYAESGIL
jgi:hypothetical protein